MQEYYSQSEKVGKVTFVCGLAMIAVILSGQYLLVSSLSKGGTLTISEEQNARLQSFALPTLVVLAVAIGIALTGIGTLLKSWKALEVTSSPSVLQRTTRSISQALEAHKRIFWLVLSLYAVIFLFTSGTVVYSEERISERYGVNVPSAQVIGCCGQPGSFPVVTIYFLEHMGLLIIPFNIIFAPFLSLLVAINSCIMWQKSKASRIKDARGNTHNLLSYCGISAGAFAGCPACATGIISLVLSGAGITVASAISAAMARYQPAFAMLSIGTLTLGLIIMSKKIIDNSCTFSSELKD